MQKTTQVRRGGRQKGSGIYSERISTYLTSQQRALLEALAAHWRCPLTEAMRRAVEVAAHREGAAPKKS